ncbi:MAG: hypothetical protein GEV10_14945 [Streptosporangiales bacterium]|nr:hypothetical protein [Streptosporangiales bacterium]
MRAAGHESQLTRRQFAQITGVAGVGLLAGACGGSGGGNGKLPTVHIQALDGGMSALSLRVIEEEGFDEAHGFKGDFQYVSADASAQNFLGHESDVAFDIGPPDIGVMKSKGNDVVMFSGNTKNHLRIITRADAPFESIDDLVGRKVGHYGDDSTGTLSLSMLLDQYHDGLSFQKDFRLVLAAPAALVPLLASDQVDAILNFEPNISRATQTVKGGIKEVYDLGAEWERHTGGTLWTTTVGAFRGWLTKNPRLAKAVLAAWGDAAKVLNADPGKIVADRAYNDLLGLRGKGLETFTTYLEKRKLFTTGLTPEEASNIGTFLELMAKQGTLFDKAPRHVAEPLDSLLK